MKKKRLLFVLIAITMCLSLSSCDRSKPEISGIKKTVTVVCGEDFNLEDYLNENAVINDTLEDDVEKTYTLDQLEHTIKCDESIYNSETGDVDTSDLGNYEVELKVADEAGNKTKVQFKLNLYPFEIKRGFYCVSGGLNGFCSFENKSKTYLKVNSLYYSYYDNDDVLLYDREWETEIWSSEVTRYLKPGETGFSICNTDDVAVNNRNDVSKFSIKIDYAEATEDDENLTLSVGPVKTKTYRDIMGGGITFDTYITNTLEHAITGYTMLMGMYNKDNDLIGVYQDMDSARIKPSEKKKVHIDEISGFNYSQKVFDQVKYVKAIAVENDL